MTEPATFIIHNSGRIEVNIGVHTVAVIDRHAHQVRYRFFLPGLIGIPRLCDSTNKARRIVLHKLVDWFEAAGPLFAPIAETLAAQAELEREAA